MRSIILIIFAILCFGTAKAQYIDGLDIREFEDETITVIHYNHFLVPNLLIADGYSIPLKRKKTEVIRDGRRVRLLKVEEIQYFITRYGYELIDKREETSERAETGGGDFAVKVTNKSKTTMIFKNNN